MGGGSYSLENRKSRAVREGYDSKSKEQIFENKNLHLDMNPKGVELRESRDSDEHPTSVPIIIALDVTGSMGQVPHELVKKGLPELVTTIIDAGIEHPQIMFLAIGDHVYDDAPLQISQFESSDELLDHWLTNVWLEGGGGGNYGESYPLAWYFAGTKTELDSFEKRGQKGLLFTIGDEPSLPEIPGKVLNKLSGKGQYIDYPASELLEKARKFYHCYHINITETDSGKREEVETAWKVLIGEDHLIQLDDHEDLASTVASIVVKNVNEEKLKAII